MPVLTNEEIVSLVYPRGFECRFIEGGGKPLFEIMWRPLNIPVTLRGNGEMRSKSEPQPTFQADADPALIASVTDYINFKYAMRKDYGRLRSVVTELMGENIVWKTNKRGLRREVTVPKYTRKEIRYFFPAILPLLKRTGLSGYLADMEEVSIPRKEVHLPFGLRKACEIASETIAAYHLLEELKPPSRVSITFQMETNYKSHNENGFKFYDFT
jgi:hypothetical protein